MTTKGNNLTEGGIYKTLLVFAVPYLIASFIQSMYGAVDLAIVGWFSDSAGISAVSVGSQVMQILTSLVAGLTMGGTILIAQYFGARKHSDTVETISTMLTMYGIAAVIFTGLMFVTTPLLLNALQTPEEAFSGAKSYVNIASCGILFIFGYNAISAILRGLGDSRSPLIFVAIACVLNIVLDLILVGPLGMGPAGAALATIISQALSMILAVIYLMRHDFIFDFKLKNFKLHKDKVYRLIKIGLPVSLQETMVNISFLFITAIVNSMGVVTSAAVGICGKFESFAMLPAGAFSAAIASMVAQNMGAGQPERAKKTLQASILLSFTCSLFFFVWAQISPDSVMGIFKADDAVTAAGAQYLRAFSFDFMAVAFVFSFNGFFNGCSHTSYTMFNGLVSTFLVRVPMAWVMSMLMPADLFGVGLAAPAASVLQIIMGMVYLRMNRWRNAKI